jgi:excisionase family DNA binding protein
MNEPILLSKHEAAAMLGLSVRTVENLIRLKELPARRIGRRCLLEKQRVESFARRDHPTHPRVPPAQGVAAGAARISNAGSSKARRAEVA